MKDIIDMDRFSEEWKREWVNHFLPLAVGGDGTAQIAVGWEHWRGVIFPKDIHKSEELFREAESTAGEIAYLNLFKMLRIEGDSSIMSIFHERDVWSLGAIYYTVAFYMVDRGMRDEGHRLLEVGIQKGHLRSSIKLHQMKYTGLRRLARTPTESFMIYKAIRIFINDKNDPRIIHWGSIPLKQV